jgi:hypothetical protein
LISEQDLLPSQAQSYSLFHSEVLAEAFQASTGEEGEGVVLEDLCRNQWVGLEELCRNHFEIVQWVADQETTDTSPHC